MVEFAKGSRRWFLGQLTGVVMVALLAACQPAVNEPAVTEPEPEDVPEETVEEVVEEAPEEAVEEAPQEPPASAAGDGPAAGLANGQGDILEINGAKVAVYKDADGNVTMMAPECPHAGCLVAWDSGANRWECPCHASQFEATGELIKGPAGTGLKTIG